MDPVFILVASAIVTVASVWPLWIRKSTGAKVVSALLLLGMATVLVKVAGSHKCDEGVPPLASTAICAGLAAMAPFGWRLKRWAAGHAFVAVCAGMLWSSHLAESYHRPEITGNPAHSSGRFWHTAITGQYPRAPLVATGALPRP